MIPRGWKITTFGEATNIGSGQVDPTQKPYSEMMHIGPENIESGTGRIIAPQRCNELGLISGKYRFDNRAVVYSKIRPNLNKVCYPRFSGVCSADAYPIWPNEDELIPEYLVLFMLSPSFEKRAVACSMRTGMPKINREDLDAIPIWFPSKDEQTSIALIAQVWDRAITAAEKLVANSRTQKEALISLLISGNRRLVQEGNWQRRTLRDLIVESRLLGAKGDTAKKITVKLYGKGVLGKAERRAGSDSTQYYRRQAGQFIYSKLDFLNGAFGIIPAQLDGFESTLDLPAFDFLPGVDPRWLLYYISREDFYQGQLGLANGGRKARRVNPSDLLRVAIDVPDIREQKVIADVIDIAAEEEKKWMEMLGALNAQKRGLMSELLNGKRRMHLPELEEATSA